MAMEQFVEMMRGGSFERMRQKIWQCLRNPEIRVFSVLGWEGVGRSMITRQVFDELAKEEEEETRASLFDHIIWFERQVSHREMQVRIAETLGIHVPEWADEVSLITEICESSQYRRLLIIKDGGEIFALSAMLGAKWIVITKSMAFCRDEGIEIRIAEEWGSLLDDEAWALLCHEAANVADDPRIQTDLPNGGDTVMQCLSYYLLFSNDIPIQHLMLYWKSEGLTLDMESIDQLEIVSTTLMQLLSQRMLQDIPYSNRVSVGRSLRTKLIQILDPRGSNSHRYSSWKGIKSRRFMVRCGLRLEQAPKVDEWEQDDLERISLDTNNIKTLADIGPSPKCPSLSTLILSHNPLLLQIPDGFFQHMQGLRVLDLSGTDISSLPSSLSSLTNLKLLALQNCPSLDTLPLPSLHALQNLKVLLLGGSSLPRLTALSLHMMHNLYYLDIIHATNLTQLSLKGCHSLARLKPPISLEMLDLSHTKIHDFAHFNFSELINLRRLDLLCTKHLTGGQWHQIDRLPQMLNWDQCGHHQTSLEEQLQTNQGYCIFVSEDKVFQTLSKDSNLWEKDLEKFKFFVVSCDHHPQIKRKGTCSPFEKPHFIYRAIFAAKPKHSTAKPKHFTESARSYHRCLKIGSTNNVPFGIRGVLYHTQFFLLRDNNSIARLSQLGVENFNNLIECRIKKCQNMQSLLTTGRRSENVQALIRLENLFLFDLINLKSLCTGTFGEGSFNCLKLIYLEHCPRLVSLFSSSVRLEKLETLEIRFCDMLERVFEEDDVSGKDVFPQLKELCLWELRKLKSICNGDLPALEKVKIHGCRRLQKLPLVASDSNRKWKDNRTSQHARLQSSSTF
ncbi:hypothetical protein AAC387_Pa06g3147 [Persea americana]